MKRRLPAHLLFLALAFFIGAVTEADAIGISPPRISINFQPGFNSTYQFFVRTEGGETTIGRSIRCDLAEYITTDLPEEILLKANEIKYFNVYVSLPEKIDAPGIHYCRLSVFEIPTSGGTMAAVAGVTTQIWITVPYPEKYLDIQLQATDANLTEPVKFTLTLKSLGMENVTARSTLDIRDESGRSLQVLDMGETYVMSMSNEHVEATWHHYGVPAGRYNAQATVEYGGTSPAVISADFKIGDLLLRIGNISHPDIYAGERVAKFQVDVESLWNEDIHNAFVTLFVSKDGQNLFQGKSETFSVGAWQVASVPIFWDATGMDEGLYVANFTVYYSGRSTQKTIQVEIKPPTNYLLLIILAIALAAAAIIVLFLIRKRRKRKR